MGGRWGPVTLMTWEKSMGGRGDPVTVMTWEGSMGGRGGPVTVTTSVLGRPFWSGAHHLVCLVHHLSHISF